MKKYTLPYAFLHFFLLLLDRVHLRNSSEITKTNNSAEISARNNFYRCSPIHEERMIARCPAGYVDEEIIRRCEKSLSSLDEEDFSLIIPATNFKSNIVYANRYCAVCHNDSSFELWDATVSWSSNFVSAANANANESPKPKTVTNEEIASTLRYDATLRRYAVTVNNVSVPCSFDSSKPDNLNSNRSSCPITFVWECPSPSPSPSLSAAAAAAEPKDCGNFTGGLICTWSNYVYANTECARCNNYNPRDELTSCDHILKKLSPAPRGANSAWTLFKFKKSSSNACSIPAVAKYYC